MTMTAKTEAFFGDGPHTLRLGLGELEELQEKTGCGPFELCIRLRTGQWRVADIQQTVRLGLIGGGLDPFAAAKLIERYAGPGRLEAGRRPAIAVLVAAISGDMDDEATSVGEAEGEAEKVPTSPTDG